jgi:hypothetical protein
MSKSVKKIISVVAAIAIPLVAPAVGSAILGSVGITSASTAVAGAVGGAVIGAGTAAVTGQDIGRGALFGGIGGGVSGYLQPAAGAAGAGGAGAAGGTTTAAGVTAPTTAAAAAPATAGLTTFTPGAAAAQMAAAGGPATAAAAAAPTTFMEALRQVPRAIADKFSNPSALADLTLRAAGQLAGSALAGEGLSADEQKLLAAQQAELAWLQQNNQALFQQRLQEAQDLLGEARYFDPEYFGLQAARRQKLAGAAQKRKALRGLTGTRRAAEERRIQLGTARNVGTAYDIGYGTGVTGRLQTRQAGLAALPERAPATYGGYEGLFKSYQQARTGRDTNLEGIGDLFGAFTGRGQAGLTGSEEEEDKGQGVGA